MNINELFMCRNLVANIPLTLDGNSLPQDTMASVILLQVSYSNAVQGFEKKMGDVLKQIKEEKFPDFDKQSEAVEAMKRTDAQLKAHEEWTEGKKDDSGKDIERPAKPSDEELQKAEETRKTIDAYEKDKKELEEIYAIAREKESKNEVKCPGTLSRREYGDICGMIGAEGKTTFMLPTETIEISRTELLTYIAANLVK